MAEVIGIDHIYITVSDLARSESFYDLVFGDTLGFRKSKFELGGDAHIQYYNRQFGYVLRTARVDSRHEPYAPGLHHFCLRVDSSAEVQALAEQLRSAGIAATPATLYPQYALDYMATFFEDPDGIRLEVTNYRQERRARHDHWNALPETSAPDASGEQGQALTHQDVLAFWFEETTPKQWWGVDAGFDDLIARRFGALLGQAAQGEMFDWRGTAKGRLAEIIVLDQFSRNIHRNTPLAFAHDGLALALAQQAVSAGALQSLAPAERSFLLIPFMHNESRKIHLLAEALFREHCAEDNYSFELRHKAIIDRFGRYPHRNDILGRVSSAEEIEFLKQPSSRF